MGLRDRLKDKVRAVLGRNAPPTPAVTAPTRPAPPVVVAPAPAVEPPAPLPVIEAPPPVVEAPAPEPVVEAPRTVALRDLLDEGAHADAPVRNAHVAAARETTEAAQQVRVYNPAEGLDITFPVEPGEYVLDAAERAGFVLPYSCRAGGCLSCSAQAQGPVEFDMGEQYVLEPEVVATGFCLLCCTSVRSAATFLSHQQDNIPA